MKYGISILIWIALTISCSAIKNKQSEEMKDEKNKIGTMDLGAFSMSLSVKDLTKSREFYEKLGFEKFAGDEKMNYLIMKNGETVIGLFHGMFEGNIMTFNPGWDQNAKAVENFTDIRKIQEKLKSKGLQLESEADAKTSGPASIVLKDPDGNVILLDQHI
jgi:catechol 2,3-dioxygenase-like lactoylglutathione lyase family enzyme